LVFGIALTPSIRSHGFLVNVGPHRTNPSLRTAMACGTILCVASMETSLAVAMITYRTPRLCSVALKSLSEVLASKKELKIGSTGAGTTTDDLARLMIGLMDAPLKVISGYKGTSDIRLAMQRKEIDGACWTWESMRTTAKDMLQASGEEQLVPYVIQGKYDDSLVKISRNLPALSRTRTS
jgi:hypothetical protein